MPKKEYLAKMVDGVRAQVNAQEKTPNFIVVPAPLVHVTREANQHPGRPEPVPHGAPVEIVELEPLQALARVLCPI